MPWTQFDSIRTRRVSRVLVWFIAALATLSLGRVIGFVGGFIQAHGKSN